MNNLQAIVSVYEQIDNFLESLRPNMAVHGEDLISQKQLINDQAYFVLAWGQFEATIKEACREAIQHGQEKGDWKQQRAWSLYNAKDRRLSGLSFEAQSTLVLKKGSKFWKQTMQHYNVRNQIAHGNLLSERINVPHVVQEFYLIQSSLTVS